jgi:hypothetical protein
VISPPVPVSDEVAAHHVAQHACDALVTSWTCPCANALVFVCDRCGEVVVFLTRPGTWCAHAALMWEATR